jgi:N-acetylmuramoyl-L-alanine amidase
MPGFCDNTGKPNRQLCSQLMEAPGMSDPRRPNGDALRCGDRGAAVTEIRTALAALGLLDSLDDPLGTGQHLALDVFDEELDQAVRAFQQNRGLLVDGIVGEATYRAVKEASYRLGARTLNHQFGAPMYGDDVATLQARLQDLGFYTGLVDGYFGLQTHNALMSYQREYGLYADGICGPDTLRSLYFLSSRVTGGSLHAIREEELVRRSGPKLSGKRIIIDPGRGGADHGLITHGAAGPISESDILWDLGSRLEGRMTAIGMETFLSRPTNRSPFVV